MDKAKLIKEYALALGFDLCGLTSADPFVELADYLKERQEQGWQSEFEFKEPALRINPRLVLPTARSIIALGKAFPSCDEQEDKGGFWGKIARCGWGEDYHRIFRRLLLSMEEFLRQDLGAQATVAMVDTGPLLERAVAVRAGLGWQGKNCSVISPSHGSFLALGEILVDLELTPDDPLLEQCGDCRRCLLACPTGALTAPYRVNPNLCLSYLTQTKSYIPPQYRKLMGNRLYGCDTCQEVCPHNKKELKGSAQVPFAQTVLSVEELLDLSQKQFQQKYGAQAFAWRGKNILLRNALIALGNHGDPEVIPLLTKALQSPSAMLRAYSAWALGQIGGNRVGDLLKKARQKENDPLVQQEMDQALLRQ